MDISTINIICVVIGCLIGVFGVVSASKDRSSADGEKIGILSESLGFIKGQMSELSRKLDELIITNQNFGERISKVEESTKNAHKRIDKLEEMR